MIAFTLASITHAYAVTIAVVVHPSNPVKLSSDEIANVFLGNIVAFKNGSKIITICQSAKSSEYQYFIRHALNKHHRQMKAYWAQKLFAGRGTPPLTLACNKCVVNMVSKNPSAIGYINIDSVNESVRVIYTY